MRRVNEQQIRFFSRLNFINFSSEILFVLIEISLKFCVIKYIGVLTRAI